MSIGRIIAILLVLSAIGVGYILTTSPGSRQISEQDMVLANVREALELSANSSGHSYQFVGKTVDSGISGEYRLTFDRAGKFVEEIDSEYGRTTGFDGKTGWGVNPSGMPRTLGLGELAWEKLVVGLTTGDWLHKNSPFKVTGFREDTSVGSHFLEIAWDEANLEATIEIETDTWLPKRLFRASMAGEESMTLGAYQELSGLVVPTQIEHHRQDLLSQSIQIEGVQEISRSASVHIYDPITARPHDYRFDPNISPEITVARTPQGHFMVKPMINGTELNWFFLDTGAAVNTISGTAAERAGLREIGSSQLQSIFGLVETPIYKADELQLGPATLDAPFFYEMDFAPIEQAFNMEIDGVVGFDFFARAVIELEMKSDRIAIFDPETYDRSGISWVELILDSQHPVVKGSFEGVKDALFRLDIGAGHSNVIFHTPAVKEHSMLENRETETRQLGQFDVAFGEIESFEFAGKKFENLPVGFAITEGGPFSDPYTVGNIGGGLLGDFRVVFDYSNERIAFIEI